MICPPIEFRSPCQAGFLHIMEMLCTFKFATENQMQILGSLWLEYGRDAQQFWLVDPSVTLFMHEDTN